MSDVVWPGDLPQLPLYGAKERLPQNTIRSQTDAGIDKVRRRFTSAVKGWSGMLIMTLDQMDLFEDFYRDTLQDGALSFQYFHSRTNELITVRFKEEPPEAEYFTYGYVSLDLNLEILP